MKPTSTLDIILAVIQLAQIVIELLKGKDKKNEVKTSPNPLRTDHSNVLDEFLGRK